MLTSLSARGMTGRGASTRLELSSRGGVITPAAVSETACRGVESLRHHLSAALISFLEVSCRSCWTHPPPFPIYPQPVSSYSGAAKSEEASHPAEYHGSSVSLSSMSACHLHVQHPIPPPIILFPHLLFHFPRVLLRWAKHAYRWPPGADPWLVDTAFITSPVFNSACTPSTFFFFLNSCCI